MKLMRMLVRSLPQRLSFKLVAALATRTQRPPLTPAQAEALALATRIRVGPERRHVAWQWGETGPLVVLVHGWNGRSGQMAPLAAHLAACGFRCIALEVTGHGDAPGRRTRWRCFIDEPAELVAALQGEPVHAVVGHSAGGLAAMASRSLKGLRARRWVCICSPSHPFPPIDVVRKKLDPPAAVVDLYREHIAQQFTTTWADLAAGRAFAGAGPELLLLYDEADRVVDPLEGDRIARWCPGAQLVKTTGHGHTKVLAAPELKEKIAAFLLAEPPAAGSAPTDGEARDADIAARGASLAAPVV
ncbi:alpha/beta fold hydrolase [Caldimonas brevitalea]|nr:alpha/beta fold hydrolase [Caldimonas brevitalea]